MRCHVFVQVLPRCWYVLPEKTSEWATSLLLAQKSGDASLEKLENVIKNHGQKSNNKTGQKCDKKQYEEQHEFNLKVFHHLENVASLESNVGKASIRAGMSLIKEANGTSF